MVAQTLRGDSSDAERRRGLMIVGVVKAVSHVKACAIYFKSSSTLYMMYTYTYEFVG